MRTGAGVGSEGANVGDATVSLEEGIAELRASGAEAMEVIASAGSPMNPAVFEPVTRAGRAQGLRVVAQRGTTGFW